MVFLKSDWGASNWALVSARIRFKGVIICIIGIPRRLCLLKGARGHLQTNPQFFVLPRFLWTGPETTLEGGFKRMPFGWAVWARPVRKNLHQLWGFIFFKTIRILVSLLHGRSRLYSCGCDLRIDHDRRQRERIKAISSGCLGYFGNRIFFYTTRPSRAPTQSIRIRAIMLFQ